MTYRIAHSLGLNAANRQMSQAGRIAWNEEDAALASHTLNTYFPLCNELPGDQPGSVQVLAMRTDLPRRTGLLAVQVIFQKIPQWRVNPCVRRPGDCPTIFGVKNCDSISKANPPDASPLQAPRYRNSVPARKIVGMRYQDSLARAY